jgi:3-oxoacyl-[acyl-carrier protein] reductase
VGRLDGKVAVVTGGASGFGAATARKFVAEGARVVVADVNGPEATAVAEELGESAVAVEVDVREARQVQAMVDAAEETFGGLDVLVNNAGLTHALGPIDELSESDYHRVMDINVKGVWLGVKHGLPALRRRGGGVILNTSSVGALLARPNTGIYYPSKAAVISLTQSLALELAPTIRVNCVAPLGSPTNFILGAVGGDTDAAQALVESGRATRGVPLGRMAEPTDVANAFAFLASDEAPFITGVVLPIDGGRTAGTD